MNIASYTKRVWSYVIDAFLAIVCSLALFIILYIYQSWIRSIPAFFVIIAFFFIEWLLYTFIYSLWLFISNGRTLGSLIFGTRVVHNDVSRLSFGDCLARCASEGVLVLVAIDLIYVLIKHTEKTIFDRLSLTVVVDWRNRSN